MAQNRKVIVVDDIDPKQLADETVKFSLDGIDYEIDLTSENARAFRNTVEHFRGKARRTGGRRTTGRPVTRGTTGTSARRTAPAVDGMTREDVINYAKTVLNVVVKPRGRLSQEVADGYVKAVADGTWIVGEGPAKVETKPAGRTRRGRSTRSS